MSLTCFGQDSLSIDTRQTNGVDSIHASHTTFSSNTLEDATKAEGDSAYIKEDYAAAIQIYEALLKNGEAADVYYNLGNSYYKIGEIAKAGTHPTIPSSSRISFHSFIELSLTLTFLPSWRINKLVPLSLGVLRTVTLGFITIASLRLTKCSFCCEAKRLEQTVTISKMIPDMNPIFFNIICLENIKK